MEYFVEQASTHREAELKVRTKYGEQARITHHRTVRVGGFLGLFSREGVEVTGYLSADPPKRRSAVQVPRDLEEEKRKLLGLAKGDRSMEAVLAELRSLKGLVTSGGRQGEEHPTLAEIRRLLEENDFTRSYTEAILSRARSELSMAQLEDQDEVRALVMQWIGEGLSIYAPSNGSSPEISILVGPTGVGKTTTIAKLAAMHGLSRGQIQGKNIRILTIDNYRIGARQQIETYGEIMGISVAVVESSEDMRKFLALYSDAQMIFVDTIGKSPRDFRKLGEMNELLSMCGSRRHVHLAVSATTKSVDLEETLRQFEPFKYESVVVTKLDETSRAGGVISVLSEHKKPISFVTDGQRVPQDIERANVKRLLLSLEGFDVPRARIERTFG